MAKTIIKELFIILLVTVAIGLVLAVIFYQYMPSNRIIPSKVTAYKASEEVAKEIEEESKSELLEYNEIYEITDADLSRYKKIDSYRPGKVDPFQEVSSQPGSSNSNETGNSSTATPEPTVDKNTTDNFYTAANVNSGTK